MIFFIFTKSDELRILSSAKVQKIAYRFIINENTSGPATVDKPFPTCDDCNNKCELTHLEMTPRVAVWT